MNSLKSTLSHFEISSIVDKIALSAKSIEEVVVGLTEAGINLKDFSVSGTAGEFIIVVCRPDGEDDIVWY